MIDVKDEILEGEPRYNILDNNGTPIQNNVQINLATPVLQPGTPINKGLFDSIKNDIVLSNNYRLPDSIEDVGEIKDTGWQEQGVTTTRNMVYIDKDTNTFYRFNQYSNDTNLYISYDMGQTWTAQATSGLSLPGASYLGYKQLVKGNGIYILIIERNTSNQYVYKSSDLIHWTNINNYSYNVSNMRYGNNCFIASYRGDWLMSFDNGTTWEYYQCAGFFGVPYSMNLVTDLTYCNNQWIATGNIYNSGTDIRRLYVSPNAQQGTWTNIPVVGNYIFTQIIYFNNKYYGINSSDNCVYCSTDLSNWTQVTTNTVWQISASNNYIMCILQTGYFTINKNNEVSDVKNYTFTNSNGVMLDNVNDMFFFNQYSSSPVKNYLISNNVGSDKIYKFDIPMPAYINNNEFKMQATNEVGIEHNYININNLGAKLINTNMVANGYYNLIYDITSDNFKMLTSTKIVTGKYVGNGNYQTKTEINVGFEPDVVFVTSNMLTIETAKLYDPKSFPLIITSQGFTETLYSGNYGYIGKHSLTANGFSISNLQYNSSNQNTSSFNTNNIIYSYVAIKY